MLDMYEQKMWNGFTCVAQDWD